MKKNKEEVQGTEDVREDETPENLPATQDEPFDDGMGEITQEDLIIPRLKVGQKQSPGDVAGKLFIDVTGDVNDEMKLVLLKIKKSRVLFPQDFSRDAEPLCRSQNFITPETDNEKFEPLAEACADCEYSKWTKSDSQKSKPPRCNEVWNFLVVDIETYMPAWFSLKSTALKPARKIISMLKLRGTAKRIPAWGFSFLVSIDSRPGDSGDSFIPVFSDLNELSKDDRENMNLIHDQLVDEEINTDDGGGEAAHGAGEDPDSDF